MRGKGASFPVFERRYFEGVPGSFSKRDGAFERRTREREQGGLRLEQRGEFLES